MASNEDIMYKIGETQADVRNLARSMDEVKNFMRQYTAECSTERNKYNERLTAVEGFQGRQIKIAGGISLFISTAVGLAMEYFKKG